MSTGTLRHYDVVAMGRSIGTLACAALLARRGFRVLWVDDGTPPSTYRFEGLPLRRRSFAPLVLGTPSFRRLLAELAQTQTLRRRTVAIDPALQIVAGRTRFDLSSDGARLSRELARLSRELAHVRGEPVDQAESIERMLAEHARIDGEIDAIVDSDAVWPPETFWERRQTHRLRDRLARIRPPTRAEGDATPLAVGGLVVESLGGAARSSSAAWGWESSPLGAIVAARLLRGWTRAPATLLGDEDALAALLLERIRAHGGELRFGERCDGLLLREGRVVAVQLSTDDARVGCDFVVSDRPGARLAASLFSEDERGDVDRVEANDDGPRTLGPRVGGRRVVLSLIVRRALIPAPLGPRVILPVRPGDGVSVILTRASFAHDAATRELGAKEPSFESDAVMGDTATSQGALGNLDALDAELWVAEALVDEGSPLGANWGSGAGSGRSGSLREAILRTIARALPFLDRHLLVADSPNDGAPLWDFRDGSRRLVPRQALRSSGGPVDVDEGEPLWMLPNDAYAGLSCEPVRVGPTQVLTVGSSVLPTLGDEGALIAAWSAARIVTKSDARKEQMRRLMWTKIEL